jgi:RPA family protein
MRTRTKEHNKKIGQGVKAYYAQETQEQKAKRLKAIEKRQNLKSEFESRLKELFELYEMLNGK